MCVVGVMQGQYYLVWGSYYNIGQRLKVLQQNKVIASKNYMLGLYRGVHPMEELSINLHHSHLRGNCQLRGRIFRGKNFFFILGEKIVRIYNYTQAQFLRL